MLVPEVEEKLEELRTAKDSLTTVDTVVLCGIETHVSIIATCQDLREKGYNVSRCVDTVWIGKEFLESSLFQTFSFKTRAFEEKICQNTNHVYLLEIVKTLPSRRGIHQWNYFGSVLTTVPTSHL
jgi:hypothetical protein